MAELLEQINALGVDWHGAGTVSDRTLERLHWHLERLGGVGYSVETGTGRTTLLLSHYSRRHEVFAKDGGAADDSLQKVAESPLLRREAVTFVTGRTQQTVLSHEFAGPIDLAFLDGPHAYPFPELEYWAIYPHIRAGGMLIVDDLQLPSIANMWAVLRTDRMWDVLDVSGDTGILTRTDAPTLDPYGDGWWEQDYNRGVSARHLPWRSTGRLKALVPERVKWRLRRSYRPRARASARRD